MVQPSDEMLEAAVGLFRSGHLGDAERTCRRILRDEPGHAPALHLLGCLTLGNPAIAAALITKAIDKQPGEAAYYNSLALAFAALSRHDDAIESLSKSFALAPTFGQAWLNLGSIHLMEGRFRDAIASLQRFTELSPDDADGHLLLGIAFQAVGQDRESADCYQRAMALDGGSNRRGPGPSAEHTPATAALPFSYVLFSLYYLSEIPPRVLTDVSAVWGQRLVTAVSPRTTFANLPDAKRRLRIGYVSGDFRRHPVGYFIQAVLQEHDRSGVEVFCYLTNSATDDFQKRLRHPSDEWRSLAGIPDDAATRVIRDDQIDILVDLSGHTAWNRLGVFARRAAPVQATWLGFFATTGVPTIDYIILDRYLCREVDENLYSEKVIRLPDTYVCYTPQSQSAPAPPPALANGYITFGCFNRVAKLSASVLSAWAEILRALPTSRLCLKDTGFDERGVRDHYADLLSERGVDRRRITFLGRSPYFEHLTTHNQIDVALDPFPFNGGTTTVEALWMGVPVVTLAGDHFVSRMGVSHLNGVGLPELIAASREEYVARAVGLARDLPRLTALRAGLRERMANSPLCDGPRFTRGLEAAYRSMWQAWCASQGDNHAQSDSARSASDPAESSDPSECPALHQLAR